MLQPQMQPQPRPQPPVQHVGPQRQLPTDQSGAAAHQHAAADGNEELGTTVSNQRQAKAANLAAASEPKPQHQSKPQQQTAAQKDKGCCGCCIM
jgi:hypothetical protein